MSKNQQEPSIKQLLESVRQLQLDHNPYHSKEDGTFTTRKDADVYSLTKNATSDPMRGKMGKGRKVSSKMGMNFGRKQCGRLNIDGTKKKKERSCYDYPKVYKEEEEDKKPFMKIRISKLNEADSLLSSPAAETDRKDIQKEEPIEVSLDDFADALRRLLTDEPHNKEIVFSKLKALGFYHSSQLKDYCKSKGMMSMSDYIKLQNAQSLASKGELYKKPNPKGGKG